LKKLLIFIPTFNRLDSLRTCIDLISKNIQSFESEVDVIISDNQSTDGTWEYLISLSFSFLICKRNDTNIGQARNVLRAFEFNNHAEFTWVIGDDDYLLNFPIERILNEINTNPEIDFYFLNTLSFPEKSKAKILERKEISNLDCLLYGGRFHSKVFSDFSCKMHEIINPDIDHTFGGAIMCYLFRSSLVIDNISLKLSGTDFSRAEACYAHTLCFYRSLSPHTKSRHLHSPFTYNIWHKGESWGSDGYDLAVTHGLGYVYMEACRLGYIKEENKYKYFRSYINIARDSFKRLASKHKDLPFSFEFSKDLLKLLLIYSYEDRRFKIKGLSYAKNLFHSFLSLFQSK